MSGVNLVVDTNVASYLFHKSPLGLAYEHRIGARRLGVTGSTIAELRAGAFLAKWGERRLAAQLRFLEEFTHLPETREMSELCGVLRALRLQVGQPIDWPDAWAAACALWFDVPLVTHDRDLEGIPGLRVETLHQTWRVREPERYGRARGGAVWNAAGPVLSRQ